VKSAFSVAAHLMLCPLVSEEIEVVKTNERFKRHGVQEAPAMTTRKNILVAMVGLAMLAMPVRALAGDHHHGDWDDNPRPQAWHDQGWHNGWYKNHGDRDDYRYQPAWNHEEDENDNEDCDENCGGYYSGGYQAPYYGKSLGQLEQDRRSEYQTYLNMLHRHDSRAANRVLQVLRGTDRQIAARTNGYAPPATSYNPYNEYPYGSGYNNGYYGNNGYGNNGYNGNNPMGALGALVGPLLGVTPQQPSQLRQKSRNEQRPASSWRGVFFNERSAWAAATNGRRVLPSRPSRQRACLQGSSRSC
jgi:hypothetical protein